LVFFNLSDSAFASRCSCTLSHKRSAISGKFFSSGSS
jgi:hypothetical protein